MTSDGFQTCFSRLDDSHLTRHPSYFITVQQESRPNLDHSQSSISQEVPVDDRLKTS